jgi:hypothetical protein
MRTDPVNCSTKIFGNATKAECSANPPSAPEQALYLIKRQQLKIWLNTRAKSTDKALAASENFLAARRVTLDLLYRLMRQRMPDGAEISRSLNQSEYVASPAGRRRVDSRAGHRSPKQRYHER